MSSEPGSMKLQRWLAATVFALGVVLMAMMITLESEPGALPLLMVVLGGGGWWIARRRARRRHD